MGPRGPNSPSCSVPKSKRAASSLYRVEIIFHKTTNLERRALTSRVPVPGEFLFAADAGGVAGGEGGGRYRIRVSDHLVGFVL